MMIKVADRYILRHFLLAFVVVAIAIGTTIIIINMVEKLSRFIDNRVPLTAILEYYLYFGGWVLKQFLPMFVLLAALFSVSILARRNEILALKASGRSLYRIALPLIVISLTLAVAHFYYNEYIYPPLGKRLTEIKQFTIDKKPRRPHAHATNIRRQIKPGHFYTVGSFDIGRGLGRDLKVFKIDGNRLTRMITAEELLWRNFRWEALRGVVRSFDASDHESYEEFDTLLLAEIEEVPEDFARPVGKPEDMGYQELKQYIELMKRTGGPYLRERVDLEIKRSYPLSAVIVVLISMPFAANPRRGGVAVSFAAGAVISLVYFVLFRVLQSAGYNERIPVEMAAWGVNGVFLLVGLAAMVKARK